jgi:hypothetical protein
MTLREGHPINNSFLRGNAQLISDWAVKEISEWAAL